MTNFTQKKIPHWLEKYVSTSDLELIEKSVAALEAHTSAEIVPMILRKTCRTWFAIPLLFSSLLLLIYVSMNSFAILIHHDLIGYEFIFCFFLALLSSYFLSKCDFIVRGMIPKLERKYAVEQRALVEFYQSKFFLTKDRTGILILVSLFEHQAVVLADEKIANKLPPDTWNHITALLIAGIKSEGVKKGFCDAIKACEEILKKEFPAEKDNKNEIGDTLVIRE